MQHTSTDQITKHITLRATRSRVWRALTTTKEFGTWFGADLKGDFKAGKQISGQTNGTGCGSTVKTVNVWVERLEPEHSVVLKWHPYLGDAKIAVEDKPFTQIVFSLSEVPEGTLLTVTESGFDQVPIAHRAEAMRMHTNGWEMQLKSVENYVTTNA